MNDILADTQAVVWYLANPSLLSSAADQALTAAEAAGGRIFISTISLIEVRYLVEKGKLAAAVWTSLWVAVTDPARPLASVPVSEAVASVLDQIPRGVVPDMPDRIIAATAL